MTDQDFELEIDPPEGPESAEGESADLGSERDEATIDIFGETAAAAPVSEPAAAYTVIARKYRPRAFEDLIGQEAMVRTLTNAFNLGRIAHAFMLTGVRGVGKTTTARLLARALNYESETVHGPSIAHLAEEGRHCRAIIEGRHLDVMELDAATRSKVDEMRELLDGVRYAPAQARYKVYIIDEVHMLSSNAFAALLKTLEEPPPHAKFIFATTEIRKVPVTILSRCQRFDLRRVEPTVIAANLADIAVKEGIEIEAEALTLIARAAEGSVRDAQSLLDQALVQGARGERVGVEVVRDMLGLSDRALTIELLEKVVRGEAGAAITAFRGLYAVGADPAMVTMDLLEHCHGASVAKALGPDVLHLPKDQAARLAAIGASLSAGTLSRLWQMLLRALDEVGRAPDAAAALDMILIRLAYAADLPGPEAGLELLRSGGALPAPGGSAPGGGGRRPSGGGGGGMAGTASQPMISARQPEAGPRLASFEDIVLLAEARRDIGLKFDIERYARPISFRLGAIEFEPAPGAPSNLAQRLAVRLKEWTGQPWLVATEGRGGAETLADRQTKARAQVRDEVLADPFVQSVMAAFPGTEIVEIRQMEAPATPVTDPEASDDDDDED
jgi:DNA polymerase-3 subunit gamma/tau